MTEQQRKELSQNSNINILDNYDVSTYHLKLYVAPFYEVDLDNVGPKSGLIIAETGVTDVGIDNLEFMTVFGYQEDMYTSTGLKFTFEIKEPLGTTLLDRFRIAANNIGAENFNRMPYFLEVSFRGRDKETGLPVGGEAFTKKTFPLHLLDMKVSVDQGGSVYSFTGVQAHDYSFSDQLGIVRKDLNLEVENFDDALEQIKAHLNNPEFKRERGSSFESAPSFGHIYDFVNELKEKGDWNNGEFYEGNIQKIKTGRNDPYLEQDDRKTTLHITDGTSIARVIDILLLNTKYIQKNINKQPYAENRENPWEAKELYKIKPKTKILFYDKGTKDYGREITYIITPFNLMAGITNPEEVKGKVVADDYLGNLGESAKVVRNYHYIFTGQNYNVIDFDFQAKMAWYYALPRQYGFHTNPQNSDPGKEEDLVETPKNDADEANSGLGVEASDVKSPDNSDIVEGSGSRYIARPKNSEGMFPVTLLEYAYEHDASGVAEADRSAARGQSSTFLKSYLQGTREEFLSLSLDVRGDPFWLDASDELILYFTFSVGLPQEPAEDGLTPAPQDTMITGLYQVLRVHHTFSKGKYTQTLEAVRDTVTNVKKQKRKN